jgi:hypothetical protein
MDYSQDTEVQREILSRIQKIKDEQIESKRRAEIEEERRHQEREKIKREQFIQEQISITLNSEKYESLTEEEKNIMYLQYWLYKNSSFQRDNNHPCCNVFQKKLNFTHWFINKASVSKYLSFVKQKQNEITCCMCGILCIPNPRFKDTYSYMNNIMDKYEMDKKTEEYIEYLIYLNNEELKIENERKAKETEEVRLKIEQQRIEQLNKSLDQFIRGKGTYQSYSYPFQISHEYSYLNYCMSRKDPEFVEIFWKYIDTNGGFSKCPTCGNTPKVMRFGECSIRQVGNMVTCSNPYSVRCTENLFFIDSYDSPPIENIYCCEHLYDFSNKKRYILASKMLAEKPKKEFHTSTHQFYGNVYKTTSYVEYNPKDPYGEEAKRKQDILEAQKELEETEAKMKALQEKLKGLNK